MQMLLDGKEFGKPVNTGDMLNIAKVPPQTTPLYSAEKKAWFVKADSNWIAFDSEVPGNAFAKTLYLNSKNVRDDRSGYTNAYYDKVFVIDGQKHTLTLKNLSPRYTIVYDIAEAPFRSEALFFMPVAGKSIFPWSFPECHEIKEKFTARICPGERDVLMLAMRNFSKSDMVLTWELDKPLFKTDIRVQTNRQEAPAWLSYIKPQVKDTALPDRLTAAAKWEIKANESGALWLMVEVPANAQPGKYQTSLNFSSGAKIPVEIEVLPFTLEKSGRNYGLWVNSLPGRDEQKRRQQTGDLHRHGINNILLDAWTVPVPVAKDGTPDTGNFDKALAWLKAENLNQKVLIYGLLDPLLNTNSLSFIDSLLVCRSRFLP